MNSSKVGKNIETISDRQKVASNVLSAIIKDGPLMAEGTSEQRGLSANYEQSLMIAE
jgi:hypothetical protein